MIVLTFNSGSSSLKFGLYRVDAAGLETLVAGERDGSDLLAQDARGVSLLPVVLRSDAADETIQAIVSLLSQANLPAPEAIGHRIVHGGATLRTHCLVDNQVERELEAATALSPLHAPAALEIIRLAGLAWPDVPQAACLDTAFHAAMPASARTLPVAEELQAQGVQRYGFHGLSCESIVRQLGLDLPARTIIAHLGSGASVTAVLKGVSVDTSMGLTPSGGVIMGTRSGDLDPGILIYLMREKGYDAAALEQLVDHRSGMLGISGVSGDLRALKAAAPSSPKAQLAIAMFCVSVAKAIAGMIVTLGDIDAIVFTGGIGEHDAEVRAAVCHHLGWSGIRLDESQNEAGASRIDGSPSRCRLYVLTSREDEQIARHTADLIAPRNSVSGHVN